MYTTLVEAQRAFALAVADLIMHAAALGFQPRLGEAYRTPEQAEWNAQHGTGIAHSLHTQRLAIDLLLDSDEGVWLQKTEQYAPLGAWWKTRHPLARWGGDFSKPDGNHFSFEWNGVK